jgi:hypothetical protein
MNAERHIEFLRLGEQDIVIVVPVWLARCGELHNPTTLVASFDGAFELSRGCRRVAEREMGDRDQTATTVGGPVGNPPIVRQTHSLRVADVVGIVFPGEAEAGVDDRCGEPLLI